jgi:general secretion pathway protein L
VTETLLLFLGRAGGVERWLRLQNGTVDARGAELADIPPPGRSRDVVAVVPGEQVTLHWLEFPPNLAPAQALAAARLLAADATAQPIADMHVAVGRAQQDSPLRPVALVASASMTAWLDLLRGEGLEPEAMVPDTLLLPLAGEGFTRLPLKDISLYRGAETAFAMEPELGALVTGEAPVADIDEAWFEAGLGEAIFLPPLNLRQGAFARRREWRVHGPRLRRLALLAASLLLATLAIHVAQIVRYTYAADAAEEETRAIASGALRGRVGVGGEGLGRRLAELRGGGAGFTATASAVFGAVKSAPNVELSALAFLADGSLRVTAAGDSPASLAELVRRIEAGGFAVEPAPPRAAAGRQLQDLMVRPR